MSQEVKYGAPRPVNKQTIFNKSATHLLRQGKRSQSHPDKASSRCMYRYDGLACAVGCLITDKQADLADDRESLEDSLEHARVGWDWRTHYSLLDELQKVHDAHEPRNWKLELKDLGKSYGLDVSCLEDF